jgi:integrase
MTQLTFTPGASEEGLMRERTGQIKEDKERKIWIARVCYKNRNGKRTAIQRSAPSKAEARAKLKELLSTLNKGGRESVDREKLTVNDLVEYFETNYVKPARFVDDRKVEGFKDVGRVKGFLKHYRAFFGNIKLDALTYDDIRQYRSERLSIQTHYKKQRTIATMNRELAYLRRILNVGLRKGWLQRNPFNMGEPLIDVSAERRRERTLTFEEEQRLLSACNGRRAHLRPLIICLLTTGARKGEVLKLLWSDIDWETRLITFRALNTKTLKTRKVAINERLYQELRNLWSASDARLDSKVFSIKSVRKSFESACKLAGIETGRPFGITLHSLRHTVAFRLISGNFPLQFTARILGHQTVSTSYRYLSANEETLHQAASILQRFQEEEDNNG